MPSEVRHLTPSIPDQAAAVDWPDAFHSSSEVGLGTRNSGCTQPSQCDCHSGAYTLNGALLVLL